jgi:hypothetical protein
MRCCSSHGTGKRCYLVPALRSRFRGSPEKGGGRSRLPFRFTLFLLVLFERLRALRSWVLCFFLKIIRQLFELNLLFRRQRLGLRTKALPFQFRDIGFRLGQLGLYCRQLFLQLRLFHQSGFRPLYFGQPRFRTVVLPATRVPVSDHPRAILAVARRTCPNSAKVLSQNGRVGDTNSEHKPLLGKSEDRVSTRKQSASITT